MKGVLWLAAAAGMPVLELVPSCLSSCDHPSTTHLAALYAFRSSAFISSHLVGSPLCLARALRGTGSSSASSGSFRGDFRHRSGLASSDEPIFLASADLGGFLIALSLFFSA